MFKTFKLFISYLYDFPNIARGDQNIIICDKMLIKCLKLLSYLLIISLNCINITWAVSQIIENPSKDNVIILIDEAGRKITMEKGSSFNKIVSLYGAHTENLYALGLKNKIVGVSNNEVFPKNALLKKKFSYHDDPEKFLATRPDLVLIRPMIDRGYSNLIKRLEKSNIKVFSLQPTSIEQMYVYWNILGYLGGVNKNSKQMVIKFKNAVLEFNNITGKIKNKKKVYFESMHSRMKTFSQDSISMFVLKTAGGINIATDAMASRGTNIAIYGKERILSNAENIEVFLAQKGFMNNPTVDIIKNEPGFNIIKAVRENKIYIIDEMIVSRPSIRLLDGIYYIGKKLYPDIFKKIMWMK